MDAKEAKALALELMRKFGLSRWQFAFSRSKTRIGLCHWRTASHVACIYLSKPLVELNDEEVVRETILHEIAHALTPPPAWAGPDWDVHNDDWKAKCRELGCDPNPFCLNAKLVPGRWQAFCPKCRWTIHEYRRPKKQCPCRKCPQDPGTLQFVDTLAGATR